MKIKYTKTTKFETLQREWHKLANALNKSVFGLFENDSFDEATDTLMVKHPDISSTKPIVKGTVRMSIKDNTGMAADIDDPTWADVANFFSNHHDDRNDRLTDVQLVTEPGMNKEGKPVKNRVLKLHTA